MTATCSAFRLPRQLLLALLHLQHPCSRTVGCGSFAIALLAAALSAHAAWIPLKAALAQRLMQRTWAAVQAGDTSARPWPWADTRPVAVLRVPRLGIEQFVLQGSSGRNLAFGPAFVDAEPAGHDRILSGHRDTHFRFLETLREGDIVVLETAKGGEDYSVDTIDVIDSRTHELVIQPGIRRLSLVTCYPFDAAAAGGPLRYVVTALAPGVAQAAPTPRRPSAALP